MSSRFYNYNACSFRRIAMRRKRLACLDWRGNYLQIGACKELPGGCKEPPQWRTDRMDGAGVSNREQS